MTMVEAGDIPQINADLEKKQSEGPLSVDWLMTAAALQIHAGNIDEAVKLVKEARAAEATGQAKDALSVVMDEKALFERTGATLKPLGQLKVILTSVRKKDLTPAQFKEAALKGYAKADSKLLMHRSLSDRISLVAPGFVRKFLECGDLKYGFARVRRPKCREEYFVPFSCRVRCFCPSCHEKRALEKAN